MFSRPPPEAQGGDLLVTWITEGAKQDLKFRRITAAGAPSDMSTIASGFGALSNPAIVHNQTLDDNVYVFAGGVTSGDSGLHYWYSGNNGRTFGYQWKVSGPGGTAYQSPADAVLTPAGILQTWYNPGVYVHAGLANGGDVDINDVGTFCYNPAFGYEARADALYVAAAYNATGNEGLWVRRVDPVTGAAMGSSFELLNSWSSYWGTRSFVLEDTRTPVVGLTGQPVVLVAYPTGYPTSTTMRVWRLSAGAQPNVVLASGGSAKGATAVAADPSGRAWVVWTENNGARGKVYARRSNVGATAWGQTVSLLGPSGAEMLRQLTAAAQSDRVDVLGQFDAGDGNQIYHAQLLAGLTVTASPAKVKVGKRTTVKVTVKDAGAPVSGVKVTIGARSRTTSAAGVAKVKVKAAKPGKLKVSVKKTGYATGTLTLKAAR